MDRGRLSIRLLTLLGAVGAAATMGWGGLTSCVAQSEDDLHPTPQEADVVVSFAPSVGAAQGSRAVDADGRGPIATTEDLQGAGFGVFAYYSAAEEYQDGKSGQQAFNFMWNQQVTWAQTFWTYSPLKYWPNDNREADHQGAVGSAEHSYVSFFAYAPYTTAVTPDGADLSTDDAPAGGDADDASGRAGHAAAALAAEGDDGADDEAADDAPAAGAAGGITVSPNHRASGRAAVAYRMAEDRPFVPAANTDLLWAVRPNLWKTMEGDEYGEVPGSVGGRVTFRFRHALSKLTISVQGLFDRLTPDDEAGDYPDDVDAQTRILVQGVDFGGSPLMRRGWMLLAPQVRDGNLVTSTPHWALDPKEPPLGLAVKDFAVHDGLRDAYGSLEAPEYYHRHYFPTAPASPEVTKELFDALPRGVTKTEHPLAAPTADAAGSGEEETYYLVIPNWEYVGREGFGPMQVRIVYHVITYDPALRLNPQPYVSVVENDITATFSDSFCFEPNKQYRLRLLLGLTTVKFELEAAEGWDVPLAMDPVVIDWHTERKEYDIE